MRSRGRETVHRSSRPRSLRNRECAASRHRRAASSAERADRALCSLVCAGTFDGSSSSVQGESLPPHLHSTLHVWLTGARTSCIACPWSQASIPNPAGIYPTCRARQWPSLSDMPHSAGCDRPTVAVAMSKQRMPQEQPTVDACRVCVVYVMFIGDLVCGPAQSVRSIYGVTCGGPRVTMPRKHNFG